MKTSVAFALAGCLCVSALPAVAADYSAPSAAGPWSGIYAGVTGGGVGGAFSYRPEFPSVTGGINGGIVGGTLGWNWQSGNLVFGIEGDLSATNAQGGTNTGCGGAYICKAEVDWLGTARARLGVALHGSTLLYITGGGAWAGVNRADNLPGVGQFNEWQSASGWTVGGGGEFMLAHNWTIKAEALWVDLNSVAYAGGIAPGGGVFSGGHMDVNFMVFRGGVNYKF